MTKMFKHRGNRFLKHPLVASLWMVNLIAIPVFSRYGRFFQRSLAESVGRSGTAWLLAGGITILLIAAAMLLVRKSLSAALIHLAWMIGVTGALMLYLRNNPERWYHILLFGMFGYLSVRLFSFRTGAEIAAAAAVLDEMVQHYLPDRVGDFEDVLINLVCVAAGIILFAVSQKKRCQQENAPGQVNFLENITE